MKTFDTQLMTNLINKLISVKTSKLQTKYDKRIEM